MRSARLWFIVFAVVVVYSWQPGQPLRSLLFLVVRVRVDGGQDPDM